MKTLIILAHAFIGWFLCAMIMAVGPALTSMQNTLIIHALAAPLIFGVLSFLYHKKFNYTSPFVTAVIFTLFVIFVDVLLVAAVILKDFAMFKSFIGTWLPFLLIFLASWVVGESIRNRAM